MAYGFMMTMELKIFLEQRSFTRQDMIKVEAEINHYKDQIRKLKPVRSIASFLKIYEVIDQLIERHFSAKIGLVSCRKGCSFCCHYNVDVNSGEAMVIVDYCRQNGIDIDRGYLEQQALLKRNEVPLHPTHSRCIFLKDGLCSIYAVRPISCRKYYVTNDPKYCDVPSYPPPARLQSSIFIKDVECYLSALANVLTDDVDTLPKQILKII
jgi:Fe-S-cluster containining protein